MKNKKGFTLVELIVVLVILAILAAVLIPTLSGYIKKAKSAQALQNAGSLMTACSFYANEQIVNASADGEITLGGDATDKAAIAEILALAGLNTNASAVAGGTAAGDNYLKSLKFDTNSGKITSIEYYYIIKAAGAEGFKCTFDGSTWKTEAITSDAAIFS